MRVKFEADSNYLKNQSCKFWHPPVCLNCKSEQGCVHGDKCHFRHVEAEGKPNKRSNKGGPKGSVAMSKESGQLGCVSQDFVREKIVLLEQEKLESKHTVKFSKGTWNQIKIRERKVPSRGIILKWSPHERCPCAPRSHEKETLHQERCARKAAWDMARNTYKLKNLDKTTFYTPIEKGMAAPASTRPEERELVVDSGASMHMMSKKRIKLRRDGHCKKVQNPCSSVDCKRRGANPRGGTSVRS